jgi:Methyltransferase domain
VTNRPSGALRIFLYNWPIYVGTWAGAFVAVVLASRGSVLLRDAALLGGALAILWSLVSLAVSFYVYDRSPLAAGAWVSALIPERCEHWAMIHAGLDAEVELSGVMPGSCLARLDIFDEAIMTAPSIRRARLRTPHAEATACSPTALALADGTCDAVVVAFTAHEIRDRGARERFFDEVRRSLRVGGTLVIVEHVRDWANFFAFGPGYLHFLPRAEWLRLASSAGLGLRSEKRVTPWVMALSLEKTA